MEIVIEDGVLLVPKFSLLLVGLALMVGWVVYELVVAPWRRLVFYRNQGLKSLPFKPLMGNISDMRKVRQAASREPIPIEANGYAEAILPSFCQWKERYAPGEHGLVYQHFTTTEIVLWDANLAREFLTKARSYKRDRRSKNLVRMLTGDGLVALDTGYFWSQQRKILNSGFRLQFLKGLHRHFTEGSSNLVQLWLQRIRGCSSGPAEILVSRDVKAATLNIISRAAFGADVAGACVPLEVAVKVFRALDQRSTMLERAKHSLQFRIPALRLLLQTETEKRAAREDKFIDHLLEEIVDARIQAVLSSYGKYTTTQHDNDESTISGGHDLVGIMVEAMLGGSKTMTKAQMLHECRTIFVAGYATTAQLITWTLLLLAHHTEWQLKAREEVRRVTGSTGILEADDVNKLHIVGMILYEVLRLYPPASLLSREAAVRHKLGHLDILPGTNVVVAVPLLHRDKKYWDKPLEFKPERFQHGVGSASLNHADAFVPFGGGSRICLGQNFALMEAKTLIASTLHHFSLQVSPSYQHSPGPVSLTSADSVLLLLKELKTVEN